MICLKIIDKNQVAVAVGKGEHEVNLAVSREYKEGDRICIELSQKPCHIWLQVDDGLGKSLVYAKDDIQYIVPFGNQRTNLPPKAFSGKRHLISVREARDFERKAYRNLALNVNDQHGNTAAFPHASANVETRDEAVFAAQNAIDGITANHGHGEWPFGSWGINRNPDARMKIAFGREVEVDRLIVYLRADFPHDNWWEKATVTFSNGEDMEISLRKTDEAQEFVFARKRISWLEVSHLIASGEPSPFPALTQLEVYGSGELRGFS